MAVAYNIPDLDFESEDQSVYASGVSLQLSDEIKFAANWDIEEHVDEGLGKVTLIKAVKTKIFGKTITIIPEVSIDFGTQFKLDIDTDGTIGVALGYDIDTGSIDTSLGYDATATFFDALRQGAGFSGQFIDPSSAVAEGEFTTDPFGASAYLDLVYKLDFALDVALTLFHLDILPDSLQPIDFAVPFGTLPTDADGDGRMRLVNANVNSIELIQVIAAELLESAGIDLAATFDFGVDGDWYLFARDLLALNISVDIDPYKGEVKIEVGDIDLQTFSSDPILSYDLFDFYFQLPEVAPEGVYDPSTGEFFGTDEDFIFRAEADLDGAAATGVTMATGLPIATDYNLQISDSISIDLTLFDLDAGPEIRVRQDLGLTPDDLFVEVEFEDVEGNALAVTYTEEGGATDTATSWSGFWNDFPELTLTEATVVRPTYSTAVTLENQTGIELGAFLNADYLALGFTFKIPKGFPLAGKTLANLNLGPVFNQHFTEADILNLLGIDPNINFFPLFDEDGIQLAGFNTVVGDAFVLDLAGTSDVGLSGIDDGVNTNAPVAVNDFSLEVDIPITVCEDESIVLTQAFLLSNDYDLDAFDTLSILSISQPVNGDEEIQGIATLREDGSVVFDTNGEFDALGFSEFGGAENKTINIEYTLVDAVGHTGTGTISILVTAKNDDPVAMADAYQTFTDEVNGGILDEAFGSLLDNDFDVDQGPGDVIRIETGTFTTALGAEVTIAADGNFLYDETGALGTINALGNGEVAFDTFTYTIRDQKTLDDEEGVTGNVTIAIAGSPDTEEPLVQDLAASPATLTVQEGSTSGDFVLALTSQPVGDVTVTITIDDTSELEFEPVTRTFTPADWATPQVINLTGIDDGLLDGDQTVNVTATVTAAPSDPGYLGDSQATVVTVVDAPAIIASVSELTVAEDDAAASTFSVRLARAPEVGTTVTVLVGTSDPLGFEAVVTPAFLTFDSTNFDTPVDVTVTPTDDTDVDGPQIVDITLSVDPSTTTDDDYDGVDPVLVKVIVEDDENQAPVAILDESVTDEETSVNFAVIANDSDPDGDDIAIVGTPTADNGTVVVEADGSLTYTPDEDFFGTEIINYTIADTNGVETSAPWKVTVSNVNDAPVTTPLILVIEEDTAFTLDLLASIVDADGDDLTITIGTTQNGAVNGSDGIYTFIPGLNFFNSRAVIGADGNLVRGADGGVLYQMISGSETAFFDYTVNDGTVDVDGSVLFMVTPGNDAPFAPDVDLSTDEDTELAISVAELLASASDPDGDALTLVDVGISLNDAAGMHGAIFFDQAAGTIFYDPFEEFQALPEGGLGTDSFTYTVEDEFGQRTTATINIEIDGLNDAPEAIDDAFQTTLSLAGVQGATLFGNLLDNDIDPDSGDVLTATLGPDASGAGGQTFLGASIAVNADGSFTYDVDGAFVVPEGEIVFDYFDYFTTDFLGATSEVAGALVAILGTDTAAPGPGFLVSENSLVVQEATAFAEFYVALTAQPTSDVTLNIGSSDETEATTEPSSLTFTPDNWDTPQSVLVQAVDDGILDGDQSALLTVSVDASSDADFTGLDDKTVDVTVLDKEPAPEIIVSKDVVFTQEGGATATFDVTLGIQPSDEVMVLVESGDTSEVTTSHTTLTFDQSNWFLPQTVTVSSVDDDLFDFTQILGIALTVDPDSDAAEYIGLPQETVRVVSLDNEQADLSTIFATEPTVSIRATDAVKEEGADGATTTYFFTLTRSGNFLDQESTVSFSIDGDGGAPADTADFDGGILPSGAVIFAADETEKLIEVVVTDDSDVETDEFFTVTIEAVDHAIVGSSKATGIIVNDDLAALVAAETLTLDIDPTSFSENGGSATATVTRSGDTSAELIVNLLSSDTGEAAVPTPIVIAAGQSTSDPFNVLGVDDGIQDGTQTVDIRVSATGYIGDAVSVDVTDDDGGNNDPTANDDSGSTDENSAVSIDLTGNDTDIDTDDLEILSVNTTGLLGTVAINPDNDSVTYDPNGQFSGLTAGQTAQEQFTYIVGDGNGGTDEATVTVTINGASSGPDAINDEAATDQDSTVSIPLTDNDIDTGGDDLEIQSVDDSGLLGLVSIDAGDNSVTYDPNGQFDYLDDGEEAEESFKYTVEDEDGATDEATVTVTIQGINDAPVFTSSDTVEVPENQTDVLDINATDPEGDTEGSGLTYAFNGGADDGLFDLNTVTGELSFTSAPDFENPLDDGGDNFYDVDVLVTDSGGESTSQSISVEVTNVNEPVGGTVTVSLIDSDTDQVIQVIGEGDTVLASTIANRNVTLGVTIPNTSPLFGQVESAFLDLNDGDATKGENEESYALFGNVGNDFYGDADLPFGANKLDLDLFSQDNRTGTLLEPVTRNFTVVDDLASAPEIQVSLIDTDTDEVLQIISEGDSVLASTIEGRNVTLGVTVPNSSPLFGQVESAFLDLNNGDATKGENAESYALFGNVGNDFFGDADLPIGGNVLSVDLFSQDNRTGTLLDSVDLNFTVIDDLPEPQELEIGIFDTETDALITMIQDGDTFFASDFAGRDLTISALVPDSSPFAGQVESMFLNFNNGQATRTEDVEPYALFGDTNGDFFDGFDTPIGDNTISFDLFSQNQLGGTNLGTIEIDFTIENDLIIP